MQVVLIENLETEQANLDSKIGKEQAIKLVPHGSTKSSSKSPNKGIKIMQIGRNQKKGF